MGKEFEKEQKKKKVFKNKWQQLQVSEVIAWQGVGKTFESLYIIVFMEQLSVQ